MRPCPHLRQLAPVKGIVGFLQKVLIISALLCSSLQLVAQAPSPTPTPTPRAIKVALSGATPFLYQNSGGEWEGLSLDIFNDVAAQNNWSFVTQSFPSREAAIEAVARGEADVLVGEVSILSDLMGTVEFSQPYFRSGLQIMVTDARPHTMGRLWQDLYEWGHMDLFWGIIGVIIILTILVAFFERAHNPDFPKKWGDGLAESFYYVVSLSLGKSGYKGFGGWLGRLVLVVWTIAGVIVVAYVTSSITSVMTVEKLRARINGPQDLPGHTVGAVKDTPAIEYLQRHGITYRTYPDLATAVHSLVNKDEIQAIVGSAPVLQFYDNSNQDIPITEVGPVFSPFNYGFALPLHSDLRLPLNATLLNLQENGVILDLARRYFGPVYNP